MERTILEVFKQFLPNEEVVSVIPFSTGHINDTYAVKTIKQQYVLQAINTTVFPQPKHIIANKVRVSEAFNSTQTPYEFIRLKAATTGAYYVVSNEKFWALMHFINGQTYELTQNTKLAFEAGKLYGHFLKVLCNEPVANYHVILPNFHDLSYRYNTFEQALLQATPAQLNEINEATTLINTHVNDLMVLNHWLTANKIPKRIVHNDTKITNILFDAQCNGLAVIDTDTVMPGCIAYDFGDAVRTICATTNEDEVNLTKVGIDLSFFEQFTKGFSLHLNHVITATEIDSLLLGVKFMPFIMGVRFLTDYLYGNVYFKTAYKTHNLDRASNQFMLFKHILKEEIALKEIINNAFLQD